ncbi:MAG TPA: ABC transporter ATP-binding protein, partial [Chloroflexia bacterium]|nr:ABC transporter ATP-binding protein [Chloroflexia bacterium]
MSDRVIKINGLGKKYTIGRYQGQHYLALRDVVADSARRLKHRLLNPVRPKAEAGGKEFWALRDVSFEVSEGEVVGIIGKNGAGKSTLLKILSRITEPTEGSVRIRGRLASLLEVGTGFHPELTGRENIFLNGAILGMTRADIRRRFDEIVDFAEVAEFLDTPVKRYSSGMYVRLAFAVAAHLEPEILVIDEVLAVGDVGFQKKSLGKMGEVAKSGRTVLFVSHNMGAVSALCSRAVLLSQGGVLAAGDVTETMELYLSSVNKATGVSLKDRVDRQGSGRARVTHIHLLNANGTRLDEPLSGAECTFVFEYESPKVLSAPKLKFTIYNRVGQPLTHFDSTLTNDSIEMLPAQGLIGCRLRRLPLSPGLYRLNVSLSDSGDILDYVIGA